MTFIRMALQIGFCLLTSASASFAASPQNLSSRSLSDGWVLQSLPKPAPHGRTSEQNGKNEPTEREIRSVPAKSSEDIECLRALHQLNPDVIELDPIAGEGECGINYPVKINSTSTTKFSQPAILSCDMALQVTKWIDRTVTPLAAFYLGESIREVGIGTSYHCRKRRGSSSQKYSEHAFANALDIHRFVTMSDRAIQIKPRAENPDKDALFQAAVRGASCAYFNTVLGPMTNEAHKDHLHLDRQPRRGGYRLCE